MILSEQEIADITGKTRHDAQARELAHLNIPHRRRTDGSIVVFKDDLTAAPKAKPRWNPDFSKLSKICG